MLMDILAWICGGVIVIGFIVCAIVNAVEEHRSFSSKSPMEKLATLEAKQKAATNKDASVVGRAVAGGIIAGPAGAIVGAISAADKNNKNAQKK